MTDPASVFVFMAAAGIIVGGVRSVWTSLDPDNIFRA
jgi:hypothetical protein